MIGLFEKAVDRGLWLDEPAKGAALKTALGALGEKPTDGLQTDRVGGADFDGDVLAHPPGLHTQRERKF